MSLPVMIPILQPHRTIARVSSINNNSNGKKKNSSFVPAGVVYAIAAFSLLFFLLANLFWLSQLMRQQEKDPTSSRIPFTKNAALPPLPQVRRYPPHRYYQLHLPIQQQPDFLTTQTEYIYGEWPVLLQSTKQQAKHGGPVKLVVDQSEWQTEADRNSLPFADGTNPSILTMARLQQRAPVVAQLLKHHYPTAFYVTTVCMTDSQCSWRDGPHDIFNYHLSTQSQASTIRTLLIVLNEQFRPLDQTTIYLERNAAWGKNMKRAVGDRADPSYYHMPALDDARLFVHQEQLWVSFREGRGFGWDAQVLNPIHLQFGEEQEQLHSHPTGNSRFQAHILASETTSFCCGRNMALMEDVHDSHKLKSLTWVDPVTTITVDTTRIVQKTPAARRRLAGQQQQQQPVKHKSHIHGTNAFMLDLPNNSGNVDSTPFLGVAHFHRPNDRNPNPYARFGHHYTHAFYTIQGDQTLTALSAEFVLPSAHVANDAEVIQFASGLEYNAAANEIVIAYGINDCEAAIATFDLEVVQEMLRPVPAGKQVLDFMKPLQKTR